MIKALFFDLDGTLLDTLGDLAGSMNRVLKRHGYPVHSITQYRFFIGDGVAKLVERALPKDVSVSKESCRSFLDEYLLEYGETSDPQTKPFKGITDLLDGVAGYHLAVVTNKPQERAEEAVDLFFPNCFSAVVGDKPGQPVKPDPEASLKLCRHLNILPEEVLFIGDSGVDMALAKAAGFYGCGVLWGYRGRSELEADGADALVGQPDEILTLLDSLKS